jgi:hypothetical protein|tara:strand:- start:36 stop:284 length:249 start_codon:yes stop_codon:yes gene_type:complete
MGGPLNGHFQLSVLNAPCGLLNEKAQATVKLIGYPNCVSVLRGHIDLIEGLFDCYLDFLERLKQQRIGKKFFSLTASGSLLL